MCGIFFVCCENKKNICARLSHFNGENENIEICNFLKYPFLLFVPVCVC